MSITKQRWQLTRCDSTLEHFSSGEIKFLHLKPGLKPTSAELRTFKGTHPLFCLVSKAPPPTHTHIRI